MFNLIDESTGECHCIHADRCLKAAEVLRLLKEAIASKMDRPNRSEATTAPSSSPERFSNGFREDKIKTIYIDPGCPWSRSCGSYAESFNSRFRVECLDRELLYTLSESGASSLLTGATPTTMFAPTVPWACRVHRSMPETNQTKALARVALRAPTDQSRQQSNINTRKISHSIPAQSWGPTTEICQISGPKGPRSCVKVHLSFQAGLQMAAADYLQHGWVSGVQVSVSASAAGRDGDD